MNSLMKQFSLVLRYLSIASSSLVTSLITSAQRPSLFCSNLCRGPGVSDLPSINHVTSGWGAPATLQSNRATFLASSISTSDIF
ncbi:hypothetical protein HOLleu_41255 [Holothuria leucospilota]|uniref:Secreted protein n=1 Tax=Holothuria leucospilota TaxID=206669 RepID=A0A9Q0YDZ1_HOLLE|nr:hypothetical protein HOLleu_41255 [Holothuria leucospilota]